ncbi:MAG: Crp/Fnr family transcriptional regulator [Anaerolineae bacterium]|nr:Crp/Fnr family transcriptional regulator [Anaerolineae bacterium]
MMTLIHEQKLRNYMLFQDLSDETLIELVKHCHSIELAAGETLFQQNDQSDALYLLDEGQVHIVRQYADGEQVILATEGPYYVIGELSMLGERPRTGAVVAVSDCTLIAIDQQAWAEVCEQMPDVAVKMIAYLAQRLHHLNLQVRENAISNVVARVASVLWLLSGGEAGEVKGRVRVSRVARAVAADADTVERILKEWVAAGYISYEGTQVTIHDIETIHIMAG